MGRWAGVRTRVERSGVELIAAELTISPIAPGFRYPVPDTVELLDRPPRSGEAGRYQREGQSLHWIGWACSPGAQPRYSPPIEACLSKFIALVGASPETIVEFAR